MVSNIAKGDPCSLHIALSNLLRVNDLALVITLVCGLGENEDNGAFKLTIGVVSTGNCRIGKAACGLVKGRLKVIKECSSVQGVERMKRTVCKGPSHSVQIENSQLEGIPNLDWLDFGCHLNKQIPGLFSNGSNGLLFPELGLTDFKLLLKLCALVLVEFRKLRLSSLIRVAALGCLETLRLGSSEGRGGGRR
jgi:hypothetical protein